MSKYLCKIVDVFQLQDRLVVQSDITVGPSASHEVSLEVRRPDGTVVHTKGWRERFSPSGADRPICWSVEERLSRDDIPVGSEIWIS